MKKINELRERCSIAEVEKAKAVQLKGVKL